MAAAAAADGAAENVIFTKLLNADGQPLKDGETASIRVTVVSLEISMASEVDLERRSLSHGVDHWCHGTINSDYIADQIPELTYLMRVELIGRGVGSGMRAGFATLISKDDGETLYIDVICAKVTDMMLRRSDLKRISAGKIMLDCIEEFARERKFKRLMLSSLAYVIGYYQRLGFQLDAKGVDPKRLLAIKTAAGKFGVRTDEQFEIAHLISHALVLAQPKAKSGQELSFPEMVFMAEKLNSLFDGWQDSDEKKLSFYTANGGITVDGNNSELQHTVEKELKEALANPAQSRLLSETVLGLRQLGLSTADRYAEIKPGSITSRHAVTKGPSGKYEAAGAEQGFLMVKDLTRSAAASLSGGRTHRHRPRIARRRTQRRPHQRRLRRRTVKRRPPTHPKRYRRRRTHRRSRQN